MRDKAVLREAKESAEDVNESFNHDSAHFTILEALIRAGHLA